MKLLDWGEDGMATTAETAALRSSFQQEVAVWQKLDHPNVTKVQTHSYLVICSTDHHDGYKHLNVKTWTKTFKGFYFVLTSEILGM